MALNNPTQEALKANDDIRNPKEPDSEPEEQEDKEQLEKLELEVKQMAKKIMECRATIPDQLKSTFASLISVRRPIMPDIDINSGSDPGPSGGYSPDPCSGGQVQTSKAALLAEEDQKTAEKVRLLKDKISSNISAMPIVLKRMKECMSKIDKLDSYNGIIHPAFQKRPKLSQP